jgi:hypothetical protein
LWNEKCDFSLKAGIDLLKEVYLAYLGKSAGPTASKYMSCLEFEDLITQANVYSRNFGSNSVSLYFNLSMMTQVDEIHISFPKHMNMNFTEFVEAISRVAEQLEIPHPLEVEEMALEEVTQEERERWGARPLHEKIEILLLMMAKNCMKPGYYETH